ncbi:DUF742 domain-containing protein, partial [Streptomyces sp. NPDC046939]|uniref:DUF742 domain-containing protein n=1 Tax=Streptomyces sp. NPDC046939 TaxID=3155376 RepID=UPI0033D0C8DB
MSADGEETQETQAWFDDEAGPVVRPYAMTRGRTSSAAQHRLDLIAVVVAESPATPPATATDQPTKQVTTNQKIYQK